MTLQVLALIVAGIHVTGNGLNEPFLAATPDTANTLVESAVGTADCSRVIHGCTGTSSGIPPDVASCLQS